MSDLPPGVWFPMLALYGNLALLTVEGQSEQRQIDEQVEQILQSSKDDEE